MHLADLANKNVVIWGSGREAAATIRAVTRRDIPAHIRVVDENAHLNQTVEGVDVEPFDTAILDESDVIVRSPGVSKYRDELQGRLITTATNLWFAEPHSFVIAFTGTKGKSTSSSLTSHVLNALGRKATLAGNIGQSPLDLLDEPAPEFWILELSSFQCSDLDGHPNVAAMTSFSPEHLDWHGGVDNYRADKMRLLQLAEKRVINDVDAETRQMLLRFPDGIRPDPSIEIEGTRLLGRHNAQLIRLVLAVIEAAGIDLDANKAEIEQAIRTFEPLPHRLQPVREVNGVLFVNDSLATTPVATIAAIEAFEDRPLTVLVGGHDRGVSFDSLGEYVRSKSQVNLITLPDSGDRIAQAVAKPELVTRASDLRHAVQLAAEITPDGGVVLLSPGAASFGHFIDYADRGRQFTQFVGDL